MIKYFKILPKTNIDFIGMRKVFFTLSGIVMILCLVSVIFKGMNYGIDFTGGTVVQVQFDGAIDISGIRNVLNGQNIDADIQTFVGKNAFSIKVKGAQHNVNEVSDKIESALHKTGVSFIVEQRDFVGPTVGSHLAKKALFAFVIAMAAMIIYIGFRFQNIIWGAMAVVALFHDVFLAIGAFSFFGFEVDLVIVAAFLTIAGFSVNDTIVIFDRVRENIKLHPKYGLKELLNLSVNETLSRTVITSLTVIVATAILFVLGGSVLRNFSLAMLIGLISGVYSTVGLVTCLVYQWTKDGSYSAMSEQSDSLASKSGFEAPKIKSKKRYR
ncbi:MAG: protein translocase subunit SecF [Elusimicrobiota bacterium]|jgi:preprotein translocase subunit SecF|nr:protein translocase subunit SecF [Elusimicrobiota bacterium]